MTRLWAAAAAFALAGCNIAYSPTPMFSAADADPAAHLKLGVWRTDQNCAGRKSTSHCDAEDGTMLVSATSIQFLKGDGSPEKGAEAWPYLIVRGTPMLMQAKVQSMDDAHKDEMYAFAALEPVTRDPDGTISRTRLWLVECGPPESHAANDNASAPTEGKNTLPGMTMVGRDCIPRDRAVLFDAATRSRAWADELLTIYWVGARPQPVAGGGAAR